MLFNVYFYSLKKEKKAMKLNERERKGGSLPPENMPVPFSSLPVYQAHYR